MRHVPHPGICFYLSCSRSCCVLDNVFAYFCSCQCRGVLHQILGAVGFRGAVKFLRGGNKVLSSAYLDDATLLGFFFTFARN